MTFARFKSGRFGILAFALVALAACAGKPTALACPSTGILADASRIYDFRAGGGQDLTDIQFAGEILAVRPLCKRNKDGIEAELEVELATQLGPAAPGNAAEFDIFVAITRDDAAVMSKDLHRFEVEFGKAERAVRTLEDVDDFLIPLAEGETTRGLQILIGYQLSAEQVNYNRTRRGL
jgi:hypothetical protein